MTPRRSPIAPIAFAFMLVLPMACKKVIGDSCTVSTDCSISGDRICDLSQTSGYCTIPGCEPASCPDNGVCVYFNAQAPRLRRRYCMAGCNSNDDCRSDYHCVSPDPASCVMSPTEVLPPGQSCNRIADPAPQHSGWCVQGR